jgi:methionine biosynthesis protein MetW
MLINSHPLVYSGNINLIIFREIKKHSKVLDVGCNTGRLGRKLIEEKGCTVYGVDISEEVVMEAQKNIDFAAIVDLEREGIPFPDRDFDVIILADILEHLKDPEALLIYLKAFLKDDGEIIISVPNVANIKNRVRLLFGKWNYTEHGILDKTHLRFFTQKTITQLINKVGLNIANMNFSPGLSSYLGVLEKYICRIYPRLFALQFIITLKK